MQSTTDIREVDFLAPDGEMGAKLLPIARRIFADTFGHLYEALPFLAFLDGAYSCDGTMARDLKSSEVAWRVGCLSGEPIGYAKLTPLRAPFPDAAPGSVELQQIYVERRWQGSGVAETLMGWALDEAIRRGAPEIYLTVFDHNERAKRFYARHGFSEVGRCTFRLGDRVDDDRVWRRRLVVEASGAGGAIEASSPSGHGSTRDR